MTSLRQLLAMSFPRLVPLVGAAALLAAGQANAGGFALNEMSASSVGNAHAGTAAAEDLSTIYFNPAGLVLHSGSGFTISGSAIRPSAKFTNTGSTAAVPPGTPLTGGNGGDAGSWAAVPAMYYATDLSSNLRFGIGVQAPFGLTTEYDDGWAGRYQALKSDMLTLNINPSIAWRVNDRFSVGAGVSAQYVRVELTQAVDFGTVCVANLDALTCGGLGLLPQGADGRARVKGDDWGFGYNLGAMFMPSPDLRFSVAYRSKIGHKLRGDAVFQRPAALPGALAAAFGDTGARASVDLPESLSLSAYAEIDPRWSVMGDVTWMRWSRFQELRIRFDNGAPDSVTPENWKNTVRVSAAVNYRYNDAWKLRAGVAYDESPVTDAFRTPRIPDSDRIWLAFGAQYKPTRSTSWDFGFAHMFVKDSAINKAEATNTLVGRYKSNVNILSVQYNRSF